MANESSGSSNNVRLVLEAVNRTNENFEQVLALMRQVVAMSQTITQANQSIAQSTQLVAQQNAKLALALTNVQAAQQKAAAASRQNTQQLRNQQQQQNATARSADQMSDSFLNFRNIIAAIGLVELGRQLIDANIQLQRITNSLEAVAGRGAPAKEEFAFLRAEADRLGLSLPVIALEYTKILAAGKPLGFSTEQIRDIFLSVTESAVVLGLSMDDVHGTLRAVQQMMSKGTVQAEELRGQLGERLPGAVSLMAKGLGVTTQQLGKMLENGQVLAKDALPALAKALRETYGGQVQDATQTTARELDRLKNSFFDLANDLNDSGLLTEFLSTVRLLTEELANLARFIKENKDETVGFITTLAASAAIYQTAKAILAVKDAVIALRAAGLGLAALGAGLAAVGAGAAIAYDIKLFLEARQVISDMLRDQSALDQKLTSQANNIRSMTELEVAYRQIVVQINAEMLKGADADFERIKALQDQLRIIQNTGEAQIASAKIEQDRLDLISKQTKEYEAQMKLIDARAKKLEATKEKFEKASLDKMTNPLERLFALQDALKKEQNEKFPGLTGVPGQGISKADAITYGQALQQFELEQAIRILEIKKQIKTTENEISAEITKQLNDQAKIEKDAQTSLEQGGKIKRLREESELEDRINNVKNARARLDANQIVFETDRIRARLTLLAAEQQATEALIATKKQDIADLINQPAPEQSDELQKTQTLIQLRRDLNGLEKERNALLMEQANQQTSLFDTMQRGFVGWVNQLGTTSQQVANILTSTLSSAIQTVSGNLADAILGTQTWEDAWNNLVLTIVKGLVQMVIQFGLQQAAMFLIRQIYGKASLLAAATEAGAAAAIWAPAATAASIATFGGAAGVGLAAFISSMAIGQGVALGLSLGGAGLGAFREGGYTGAGGSGEAAGIVHRREFVFPGDVVDKVGPDALFRLMQNIRSGDNTAAELGGAGSRAGFMPVPMPSPNISVTSAPAKVLVLHDRKQMEDFLRGPDGRDIILQVVGANAHGLGFKT